MSLRNLVLDWWSYFFESPLLTEEEYEEIRMLTAFSKKEIRRLRKVYLEYSDGEERMSRHEFLEIPSIAENPLNDRICFIFEFSDDENSTISFKQFIFALSLFNAPERIEDKLQVAFRIQDFDNDGILNHDDLMKYILRITNKNLEKETIVEIIHEVMEECASDPEIGITPANFQQVVAASDFQTKLHLYI